MTDHKKETAWRQRQDDDHDRDMEGQDRDMEGQDRDREAREWEDIKDDDCTWTKAARGYAHLCTERPAEVSFREYAVMLVRDQHKAAHSRAWRRDPLAPGTAIRKGKAKCYLCVFWARGDSTCHLEYPNRWVSPTGWCSRYEGRDE